jgi:transcriptional regulator with XRE-family HTH domain
MDKRYAIAELVMNKRKSLKENQEKFGERFNLSHAAISDLERGVTKSITEDILNFVLELLPTEETEEALEIGKDITAYDGEFDTWMLKGSGVEKLVKLFDTVNSLKKKVSSH